MGPLSTRPQYVDEITVHIKSLETVVGPDLDAVIDLDLTVEQALDLAEWLLINGANDQSVFNVLRATKEAIKAECC